MHEEAFHRNSSGFWGNLSLAINTPSGKRSRSDGCAIRRTALELNIATIANIHSRQAAIHGIAVLREAPFGVKSLQEHRERPPYRAVVN